MTDKPIWFKWYPRDFLTDDKVMAMSHEERGQYITLLSLDMINNGVNEANLKGASTLVQGCFNKKGERYFNPRVKSERDKQESQREKSRLGGIASGKARSKGEKTLKGTSNQVQPKRNLNPTKQKAEAEAEKEEEKDLKEKALKTLLFQPEHLELAILLRDKILENKPDMKITGKMETWAADIRKMCEIDNRDLRRVREVIAWCQQNDFWWKNILSASKLRKQFDKLENNMNERSQNKGGHDAENGWKGQKDVGEF